LQPSTRRQCRLFLEITRDFITGIFSSVVVCFMDRYRHISNLKSKYAELGKAEWYWLFDDTLAEISTILMEDNYVVLDNFLGNEQANKLHLELKRAYDAGSIPETAMAMEGCPRLQEGALGGSSTSSYTMSKVRGDFVAWFSGKEQSCHWSAFPQYLQRLDTIVSELGELVPELSDSASFRSNAMVSCYPGKGSHYIRHCDNTTLTRNGRKLTALFYANPIWKPGDGGELRLYSQKTINGVVEYTHLLDIEPLLDRVVLFFSDERVPHEVLPSKINRFAITTWFFDRTEKEAADRTKSDKEQLERDQKKIQQEIQKFENIYGERATVLEPDTPAPKLWDLD